MTTDDSTGSFRVTIRHVWEEQQEMKQLLLRLSDNLPNVAKQLKAHEEETALVLKDHEERLRQIESRLWKLFGALALIAGAAPFLARLL